MNPLIKDKDYTIVKDEDGTGAAVSEIQPCSSSLASLAGAPLS